MKTSFTLIAVLLALFGCGGEKDQTTLKIGDQAPVFAALDLQGNSFSLADFTGSPVIIRFWETDCKYCKADTPVFNDLYKKYSSAGLHIAYINTLSNLDEVTAFVKDLQVVFPVLMDEGSVIANQYHVRVVPQTIVINSKHEIVAAIPGGISEDVILDLIQGDLGE